MEDSVHGESQRNGYKSLDGCWDQSRHQFESSKAQYTQQDFENTQV